MPELRQDIVSGRWVVIATDRAKRPENFSKQFVEKVSDIGSCPFCYGNEKMTPPEVDAIRPDGSVPDTPGWEVRVVPNKFPAFSLEPEQLSDESLYCHRQALGLHEVIIHSPDHGRELGELSARQVELVIKMYQKRYQAAIAHPQVTSVAIILNQGREAGASLEHSHTQLFGVPLIPQEIISEIAGLQRHHIESGSCAFCDMIDYEIRESKRVIAENEQFIAFCPYASRTPFEAYILPKSHLSAFELADTDTLIAFSQLLHAVLAGLKNKLNDPPYNYWLHSRPVGIDDFHWHLEIAPKLTVPGGFEMGTGLMINVVRPEDAADYLTSD